MLERFAREPEDASDGERAGVVRAIHRGEGQRDRVPGRERQLLCQGPTDEDRRTVVGAEPAPGENEIVELQHPVSGDDPSDAHHLGSLATGQQSGELELDRAADQGRLFGEGPLNPGDGVGRDQPIVRVRRAAPQVGRRDLQVSILVDRRLLDQSPRTLDETEDEERDRRPEGDNPDRQDCSSAVPPDTTKRNPPSHGLLPPRVSRPECALDAWRTATPPGRASPR